MFERLRVQPGAPRTSLVSFSGTSFTSIFSKFSIENRIPHTPKGAGDLLTIWALDYNLQITESISKEYRSLKLDYRSLSVDYRSQ